MSEQTNQPNGTTVGSIRLRKNDGSRTDVWLCSHHRIGTRSQFWERSFYLSGDNQPRLVSEVITDPLWGIEAAQGYISAKVAAKLRSGFELEEQTGNIGMPSSQIKGLNNG